MNSTSALALQPSVVTALSAGDVLFRVAEQCAAQGYFPLPLAPATKFPFQKEWHTWPNWRNGDYGRAGLVGIRMGDSGVFVLDVDSDHDLVIPALQWLVCGAPVRFGSRGFATILRWADGQARFGHDLKWTHADGSVFSIQVKGRGQVGVFGTTDTGKTYRWEDGVGPWNTPLAALPTFESMEALLARIDEVLERHGFRRTTFPERRASHADLLSGVGGRAAYAYSGVGGRGLPADLSFEERMALSEWGDREVAKALAELGRMSAGTGRGKVAHAFGLRVGPLVTEGLLRREEIEAAIFAATGDENSAFWSFGRGVGMTVGETIAVELETLRRPARQIEEAKAAGLPMPGFDFGPTPGGTGNESGENQGQEGNGGPFGLIEDLVGALRDRASRLGSKPKSKAIERARVDFARLLTALVKRGKIEQPLSNELAALAKAYKPDQTGDGNNPCWPTPETEKLADDVLRTLAHGGDVSKALEIGEEMLPAPPSVEGGGPAKLEGGTLTASDDTFDALSTRMVVVNQRGVMHVLHIADDGSVEYMSRDDMRELLYSNLFVGSMEHKEPAFDWWRRHPRYRARRAVFRTDGGELGADEFNFWAGFGVAEERATVRPRKAARFLRHLREIVCTGDAAKYRYVKRWLAWAVQNPGLPAEVMLVFQGEGEGTGKSTVSDVMQVLFGGHAREFKSSEELLGRFNGSLDNCCFAALDEISFAGNHADAKKLRALITSPKIRAERKNKEAVEVPNRLKMIMTTNPTWAVNAGERSRRYFITRVSSERLQDFQYFQELRDDLEAGGYSELLGLLRRFKLGDWHPRQLHRTEEQEEQEVMSVDGVTQWLMHCAEIDGVEMVSKRSKTFSKLELGHGWHTTTLHDAYVYYSRETGAHYPVTLNQFTTRLKRILGDAAYDRGHIVEEKDGRQSSGFRLPHAKGLKQKLPGYRGDP